MLCYHEICCVSLQTTTDQTYNVRRLNVYLLCMHLLVSLYFGPFRIWFQSLWWMGGPCCSVSLVWEVYCTEKFKKNISMSFTLTFGYYETQNKQKWKPGIYGSPINHLWFVPSGSQRWRILSRQEVLHVVMHFSVL